MTKQRNVDWTVVFELAARQGPRALIHALQTAMETERAAFTEEYDAIVARQRAECETIIKQQRAECEALLEHQRVKYDALIEHQRAAYDERQRVAMEQLERRHFFPDPNGKVEFLIRVLQLNLCKHYTI